MTTILFSIKIGAYTNFHMEIMNIDLNLHIDTFLINYSWKWQHFKWLKGGMITNLFVEAINIDLKLPKGPDTLHFRGFLLSPIRLDLKPTVFYGSGNCSCCIWYKSEKTEVIC